MSEYEPITGELRMSMTHMDGHRIPMVELGMGEFMRLCDAIDAVHAGLERENAELRERLAALDESADSMHDGGSITDELRGWYKDRMFMGNGWQELDNIADRIDAEHQKAIRELNNLADASVLLPVDADEVPIRVGDVMEWPTTHETFEVVGIGDGTLFYIEDGSEQADWTGASTKRHHHAPTVEDVLTKFGIDWEYESNCEDRAALLKEYAAKLRLAEVVDE